jgi:hypothetical protein
MLGWGTLGGEAGRRYGNRAAIASVVFLVGTFASLILRLRPLTAIIPGTVFLYIAYEFRKYLSSLDELGRRIMLESIAWAYIAAGVLAMVLMGFIMAYELQFDPVWVVVAASFVEPIRGTSLYFIARRYQ